ncbi:glyoxalase [Micromonospora rosaria]|uniref:Glyoxalase n=1 Tax=Micromonospora rosaria TaxID=47874 RepID=A0A136PU35_9ACTN|nr:VOC family protein [Micromonospora rosaria]KXK61932.1 glyoxalase [Micromonospora rosaria]
MSTAPVTWFEVGTDRPDEAEGFYGGLFGWSFEEQGTVDGGSYRVTGAGGPAGVGGAIRATDDGVPGYAVFYVQVPNVADACRRAESAGGRVVRPPVTAPSGLVHARLADPTGNEFGVFASPA